MPIMPNSTGSTYRLLVPESAPSPESLTPSPSILPLRQHYSRQQYRGILLPDRGPSNPRPEPATKDLRQYLKRNRLRPPYVLVAHSYGGAFARMFLSYAAGKGEIVGMVLVETGQEGGLGEKLDESQISGCVLGDRPLVVIRGNSLRGAWGELEERERELEIGDGDAGAEGDRERGEERSRVREGLKKRRELLVLSDQEDERLKKRQLGLSRNARFVDVRDCGHHVVRDRPQIVADEVWWVLGELAKGGEENGEKGRWPWWYFMRRALRGKGKGGGRWGVRLSS
ncbi:hypothetical protein F4778DRAFT_767553 [Xylariomycetidae sp. FL2044]|nr:hypothetical protein F4778DRAFT_767553 [Xylariomycetidae sp. FL2044]